MERRAVVLAVCIRQPVNSTAPGPIFIQIYGFGGNPLKYTDPDGRKNIDTVFVSFMRMRAPDQALGNADKTGDTYVSVVIIDKGPSVNISGFQGSATRLTRSQSGKYQNDSMKHDSNMKLQLQKSRFTGNLSLRILGGTTIDGRNLINGVPEGSDQPNTVHGISKGSSGILIGDGTLSSEGCVVGTDAAMSELLNVLQAEGMEIGDTVDAHIFDAEKCGP
jgi:hypothetical protein